MADGPLVNFGIFLVIDTGGCFLFMGKHMVGDVVVYK